MPLSSNTLIHFTADKESLKGILSENFRVKYCKETIQWGKDSVTAIRVPMVSFCDIPLSQIKDHISKYGHYGIGLTREWAVKNKLNPVLYVQPDSGLAASYYQLLDDIASAEDYFKDKIDVIKRTTDIARYVKNYEGTLVRKGKTFRKYRFSDEREWRYVPPPSSKCAMFYMDSKYDENAAKERIDGFRLKFKPNDVKYIIIKDDGEIGEFIDHLRRAKGNKYTHGDVERLTTRLFTSDQIHKDI
jgi:hypothetical protein